MKRSLLSKDLQSQAEFIVENKVVTSSHHYCMPISNYKFPMTYPTQ